ncbi:IDEAL domain-containing protein [Peribacillus sp. NPDC097675]|uniref:IDEAL domain-containing protein n=1 Tax=Peribacillus sp. NPDC097675 TaxID=3390618 RepID=UPI003CFFBFCE
MEKQLPITPLEPEMMETLAEMVIIKALNDYRKNQIEKEIDHSLVIRDKKEFIRLTNELKSLC